MGNGPSVSVVGAAVTGAGLATAGAAGATCAAALAASPETPTVSAASKKLFPTIVITIPLFAAKSVADTMPLLILHRMNRLGQARLSIQTNP